MRVSVPCPSDVFSSCRRTILVPRHLHSDFQFKSCFFVSPEGPKLSFLIFAMVGLRDTLAPPATLFLKHGSDILQAHWSISRSFSIESRVTWWKKVFKRIPRSVGAQS
ncbi:hypothetical protein CIPAW_14G029900 [Carya illinoinensis]|uniref:Uncharacterized protein n=1 Tax=Carya illinoinensis TaxID=32201 RepID=A0A8T1NG46_CARIL|nr:hypothetical protein CIPAW_14G029900 [Carya illinoinensis]